MKNDIIKIILVDDHPLMRLGIKSSLSKYNDEINIVAEASNADEMFTILPNEEIDMVLLDVQMPGMLCEDAVLKLKSEYPNIKIIIISSACDNKLLYKLVENGINGFIPKMANVEDIKTAIQEVMLGFKYYGVDIARILKEVKNSMEISESVMSKLTHREKEIMQLCCDGLLSKEIASRLDISPRTVEMHKANIFKKLDINNTIELAKWAIEHGVVKI